MPDNLTLRLKEELARRGKNISESQIDQFLASKRSSSYSFNSSPVFDPINTDNKSSLINALGVGLWSAADTYSFGLLGAIVPGEEKVLDFEDPAAKWASAIGGLAGFVGGMPMKVGAKAVQLAAKPFISRAGKKAVSTVVSDLARLGKAEGVSSSTMKAFNKGYKNLVKRAQIKKDLAENFVTKSDEYLVKFASDAVRKGRITSKEAGSLVEALSGNMPKRPLQDFIGILAERGLAKTNPRLMKFAGHAINDALMFSLIDTVFSGVSTIDGHEFDWTAPLWGAANGVAFSTLSFMNPRGNAAKWYPDFKVGIKSIFSKNPYKTMSYEKLDPVLKFFGESLDRTPGFTSSPRINGKTINLLSKPMERLESFFGAEAEGIAKGFLNEQKNVFGVKIMKEATKASFQNMGENWMRMAAGGILFNAHTFADMFINDTEPSIHDILPHFFIGAFLQLHANPARFDMDSDGISQIRRNLDILGFTSSQLDVIPSLRSTGNMFDGSLDKELNAKSLDIMSKYYSDEDGVVPTSVGSGEVSVGIERNSKYEILHSKLSRHGKFVSNLEAVNVNDAERAVEAFEKETGLSTIKEYEDYFDKRAVEQSDGITSELLSIIQSIKDADESRDSELKIDVIDRSDKKGIFRIPSHITLDESIYDMAKEGRLPSLVDSDGNVLSGDRAVEMLDKTFSGYANLSFVVAGSGIMSEAEYKPGGEKRVEIKSPELAQDIYEIITQSEKRVNDAFNVKTSYASPFSYEKNAADYALIIGQNEALKIKKHINHVFSKDFERKPELIQRMGEAGLMKVEGILEPLMIDSISKINITSEKNVDVENPMIIEEIAELKQKLGRILEYQSASENKYHSYTQRGELKIDIGKVKKLINFVESMGVKTDMSRYLHSDMMRYLNAESAKRNNISESQMEAIQFLHRAGFADIEFKQNKKVQGFTLYTIDPKTAPESVSENVAIYNDFVRQVAKDSNGEVRISDDVVSVRDSNMIHILSQEVHDVSDRQSATKEILEFVQNLPVGNDNRFRANIMTYVENGGSKKVRDWLIQENLLTYDENKTFGYKENYAIFTNELKEKMTIKMERYGFTQSSLDRIYNEEASKAESLMDQAGYQNKFDAPYSYNDFLGEYAIDSVDHSADSGEVKKQIFESIILSPNKPTSEHVIDINVIDNAIPRLSVRVDDDMSFTKISELSEDKQKVYKKQVARDILRVISSQYNQKSVNILKIDSGLPREDTSYQQRSRFTNLMDKYDIPYALVEANGSTYLGTERRFINFFADNIKLPDWEREGVRAARSQLDSELAGITEIFGESIYDTDTGVKGMHVFVVAKGMSPIAIPKIHFDNIVSPYLEFADRVLNNPNVKDNAKKTIREAKERIIALEENEIMSPADAEFAMRHLIFEDMLVTNDGLGEFENWLNEAGDIEKLSSRIKLYDSKNFIRFDRQSLFSISKIYKQSLGDSKTADVIMNYMQKNKFDVVLWHDENHQTIEQQLERFLKKNKNIADKWDIDSVLGDAHRKVSGYDSISYVSEDLMRFLHAIKGGDPESFNPVKPIISSLNDSPLILGKTLFVYSPDLEPFFRTNKGVDILLTTTGAKVFNKGKMVDGLDQSVVNKPFNKLNENRVIGKGKIRSISLGSLGIKAERDGKTKPATVSQSDYNFLTNDQADAIWKESYNSDMIDALSAMEQIVNNPLRLRKFITSTLGDNGLPASVTTGGIGELNALMYYSTHRDANPLDFSEAQTKTKVYNYFINALLNGRKSVLDKKGVNRYGGQGKIIQIPVEKYQAKPTLFSNGVLHQRGEVFLPASERESSIKAIIASGKEIRFVDNAKEMTGEELFGKEIWEDFVENENFGVLYDALEAGRGKNGVYGDNLRIGIYASRKPRKVPNDLVLLGLKGFLDPGYGDAVLVNSFDVVNLFEGDYDADRVDYFYGMDKPMIDHVTEASKIFVQGIDPSDIMQKRKFTWGTSVKNVNEQFSQMYSDDVLAHRMIGQVQKLTRSLGYLESIAMSDNDVPKGPKILFHTYDGGKIILDYRNTDFFSRHSLESQYIIDLSGEANNNILSDVSTYRSEFMFPDMEHSIRPGEARGEDNGIGFINDMVKSKRIDSRVRIFRHINADGEEKRDLTSFEKEVINTLIGEYNKFLNFTGDNTWQRTGEQKTIKYDDIYYGAKNFFDFQRNLGRSLYYRLRYKTNPQGVKYYETNEFKKYFHKGREPLKHTYKKDGKEKTYYTPESDLFDEINEPVRNHASDIADGKRGNIADRALQRVVNADIFEDSDNRALRSRINKMQGIELAEMSSWHHQLVSSTLGNLDMTNTDLSNNHKSVEVDRQRIIDTVKDYNSAAYLIGKLNRQLYWNGRNYKINYRAREAIKKGLLKTRKEIYQRIIELVPEKFKKTFSSKDLTKYKFVPVESKYTKRGAVELHTMYSIKRMIGRPSMTSKDGYDWNLSSGAWDLIKDIKEIRKRFYGHTDSIKDVLTYGNKTLLDNKDMQFLKQVSPLSDIYEIETKMLEMGANRYGTEFLLAFMEPVKDNYSIGILDGELIPLPYENNSKYRSGSSRFNRGLKLMTKMAMADQEKDINDSIIRKELNIITAIQKQFDNYVNRRTEMHIGSIDNSSLLDIGDGMQLSLDKVKMAPFSESLEHVVGDYGTIEWNRDNNRASLGFSLMNDNILDYYRLLMDASGRKEDFEDYLDLLNGLQADMIKNNSINPIDYLSIRAKMEPDMRALAREVMQSGVLEDKTNVAGKKLLNSPVYIMKGGHIDTGDIGYSIETNPKIIYKRLKEVVQMSNDIKKLDSKYRISSEEGEAKLNEFMRNCE